MKALKFVGTLNSRARQR